MTYCILLREPDGRQEILYPTVSGLLPAEGSTITLDERTLRVVKQEHRVHKDECGVMVSNAIVLCEDVDADPQF